MADSMCAHPLSGIQGQKAAGCGAAWDVDRIWCGSRLAGVFTESRAFIPARRPVNSHWDISWFKQTNVSESARRRRLYSQMLNGTIARFTSLPWNERNTVPLSKITTLILTLTHPRCLERVHLGWQRSVLNASWAAYTASWKAAATRLRENLNYYLNASVTDRITRGPPQRSEPQQNSGVIISILIPAT